MIPILSFILCHDSKRLSQEEVADLYLRTGALVLRRCRLILRDAVEAEDVMHEVFVRVMQYGSTIEKLGVPLAWLYRTAERCCFDRLRSRKKEPLADSNELVETLALGEATEDRIVAETLSRFFLRMDDKVKQVALMHYVDGLTQEQIAAQLGWSRRTVGKKLDRLKERARRMSGLRDEVAI